MTTLILTGDRNVKAADYTAVFRPEANRFAALTTIARGPVITKQIDVSQKMSRRAVQALAAIESVPDGTLRTFAVFSHGYARGVQIGMSLDSVKTFAGVLARKAAKGSTLVVPLYCCSTASTVRSIFGGTSTGGDGGFADALRDALCQAGCTDCVVFGHDRIGHATTNPYVIAFSGDGSVTGGHGGFWIVRPGAGLWRTWRHALATGDLRLRFPHMNLAKIHAELAGT